MATPRAMATPRRLLIPILLLLLLLAACARAGGGAWADPRAIAFAPELDIDLDAMDEIRSGIFVRDAREGEGGTVRPGDRVVVHYTGWLPDGTQFESSYEDGAAVEFRLGDGEVVRGWEEGVVGMRPGGRRVLVLEPRHAYGGRGVPGVIPPQSTVVFEIYLLGIR